MKREIVDSVVEMFLCYLCLLVFVNLCIDRSVKRRTSNAMVQKEILSILGDTRSTFRHLPPKKNCRCITANLERLGFGLFISVTEVALQ